jgi:hypothetical protein
MLSTRFSKLSYDKRRRNGIGGNAHLIFSGHERETPAFSTGLCDKAKKALGDKFSFYKSSAVLGTGTVPLQILGRQVDAYIRAAGR